MRGLRGWHIKETYILAGWGVLRQVGRRVWGVGGLVWGVGCRV